MQMEATMKKHQCCILFLILLLAVNAWGVGISNIEFYQADWYDGDGVLQVSSSSWGRMDFDLDPDASSIYYLNVAAAQSTASASWIVQNMPLFSADIGSVADRLSVDFDIKELGISVGDALGSINMTYSISASVLASIPVGGASVYSVSSIDYLMAGGTKGDNSFGDVGSPAGHKATEEVAKTDVIQHKNVPGVQEGNKRCLAGALARSMGWLNVEYKAGSAKTAQDFYNDLRAKDVGSQTGDAKVTSYEDDIKEKDKQLQSLHVSETKIGDLDNRLGAIEGVKEDSTTDLIEWLKKELKTEDVELDYGRHIVTITGFYKQGGKTFVKFRDDEKQGDDTKGDTTEKEAELYKEMDKYYFRVKDSGSSFQVKALISESFIPEPASMILLGLGLVMGAVKALLRKQG
jgi:hypothetical protein